MPVRNLHARIVAKEVLDAHTLRRRRRRPTRWCPTISIRCSSSRGRPAARSGPEDFDSAGDDRHRSFQVRALRAGDRVELARNDAYWGTTGAGRKVAFRIVPRTGAARRLLSGELDAIEQVPTADLPRVRRDARLNTVQKVSWRTIFFYLDQHRDRAPGLTDTVACPWRAILPRPPGAARALESDQPAGDRGAPDGWGGNSGVEPRLAAGVRLRAGPQARALRSRRGEAAARRSGIS